LKFLAGVAFLAAECRQIFRSEKVSVEFERTAVVLITRLVKTVWLKAGDSVMMELSGLGTVAVDFPN